MSRGLETLEEISKWQVGIGREGGRKML